MVSRGASWHLYDTATNKIVRLSPSEGLIAWGVMNGLSSVEISERLKWEFPELKFPVEWDAFQKARHDLGILKDVKLRDIAGPPSMQDIRKHLASHISSVTLNVTEQCSLRCGYCSFSGGYEGKRTHSAREMDLSTACAAVDFLAQHSETGAAEGHSVGVCFYGGEPLLRVEFLQAVAQYARDTISNRGVGFHLTTNGFALTNRRIRRFLADNQVAVTVSLDGPSEIHDKWRRTRRGRPSHARVMAGLTALREAYPDYYRTHISFNAVMVPPAQISEVTAFFLNSTAYVESAGALRLSHVETRGSTLLVEESEGAEREPTGGDPGSRKAFVRNRISESRPADGLNSLYELIHARIAQRVMGPSGDKYQPAGYCMPGGRKLFITTKGELGLCEKLGEDLIIGSLEDGFDYDRIELLLATFVAMWEPKCSQCFAQRFCSICPAQVRSGADGFNAKDFADECAWNQRFFADALSSYIEICEKNPSYNAALQSIKLS